MWSAANFRFGKKFDHGMLRIKWAWRLRAVKAAPRYDYSAMTKDDWTKFDAQLRENLMAGKLDVEISQRQMQAHYDHLSGCVVKAAEITVPHKKRQNYNGRAMSEKTKHLHAQRTRDFNSGRTITKQDRATWNRVINASCKQDYEDWVTKKVESIERADTQGDTRKIASLVKRLTGETRGGQIRQPTRSKNGDLITCAEELGKLWEDFLGDKFSATELEMARTLYEDIGANTFDPECDLAHEEFMKAVKRMKSGKAVGPDKIPVET